MPADARTDPAEEVPFTLWEEYLDKLIYPDHKTTPQQRGQIGYTLKLVVDALLEYVSPKATEDNGVIMFEVKAAVKIPENVFVRAGYSANADILIDRREGVISIPESSIEFEGTKTFVNLLTSDSTATDQTFERKEIQIGLSNGVNVEVTEGLTGNEQIRGTKTTPTK